jgi:hypothetical protein
LAVGFVLTYADGHHRKDRNPKNIYYKPNKYGADLVY